ncbi:MAG: chromate efflux transporter [Bernardetiaceae bacterium]
MKRKRHLIFLRDIFWLALTAFGGPQAHMALYFRVLVKKRAYLTEEELIELHALCQILPGPTSTQTLTAIGFKRGGASLAYLTLLVWVLPALCLMTLFGLTAGYLQKNGFSLDFTRFIQPMAIGFVAYAAYKIARKVVRTKTAFFLMLAAALISYLIRNPWVFPLTLIVSGLISGLKFGQQAKAEKEPLRIEWANFILYLGVALGSAVLGGITRWLPIRLFENFYRNGSLIFGGGQVLIPILLTEFVDFKGYLTESQFLSGYAMVQAIPGPVFSFSAYVGALALPQNEAVFDSVWGGVLGALIASAGIFLPGTFLIFFVIRFWEQLKKYRLVRASLEGINGASSGLVIAGALLLMEPLAFTWLNVSLGIGTFLLLLLTRVPAPLIIGSGLLLGLVLPVG